jgi:cytochrome-b5 reductase
MSGTSGVGEVRQASDSGPIRPPSSCNRTKNCSVTPAKNTRTTLAYARVSASPSDCRIASIAIRGQNTLDPAKEEKNNTPRMTMFRAIASNRSVAKSFLGFVPPAAMFLSSEPASMDGAKDAPVMTADGWQPLELIEKKQLTQTANPTYLFRFQLSSAQPRQPVSSCLLVRAPVGDAKEDGTRADVMRPYTPVSAPDSKTLDLVVKVYPEGKIGNALKALKVHDKIDFKGPIVKYDSKMAAATKSSVSMIAGGTGITPMLQLAEELLNELKYSKPVSLVYCSTSVEDIMMRERLDALAAAHNNFSVHYMVDKAPAGWTGGEGYVTKQVVGDKLPCSSADKDSLVVVCGPPPMMNAISGPKVSPQDQGPVAGLLADLGFEASQVLKM